MIRKLSLIPLLLLFIVWAGQRPFSPVIIAAQTPGQLDQPLFPATVSLNAVTSLHCEAQTNNI